MINKLSFMISNSPRAVCTQMGFPVAKGSFLQNDDFSAEKKKTRTFLQKNPHSEGHDARNHSKLLEGFRALGSRTPGYFLSQDRGGNLGSNAEGGMGLRSFQRFSTS